MRYRQREIPDRRRLHRLFIGKVKEVANRNFERLGYLPDAAHGNIARSSFEIGNVSSVQTGALGQFLLRNVQAESRFSDRFAQSFMNVGAFHNLLTMPKANC